MRTARRLFAVQSASSFVLQDTFSRANSATTLGAADTGQGWIPRVGTWGISSNQAYAVTTGGENIALVDSRVANGSVSVDVLVSAVYSGLVFRALDGNNFLLALPVPNQTNIDFYERVAGSYNKIAGSPPGTCPTTGTITLRVDLSGTSITINVNGTEVLSTNTTRFQTATRVGLRVDPNSGAASRFDNLTVKSTDAISHTVQDSFSRANSTSSLGSATETGQAWTIHEGSWGISSNKAYSPTGSAENIASLNSGLSDGTFTWDVTLSDDNPAVVYRCTDGNNLLMSLFFVSPHINSPRVDMYQRVSGTWTQIGTGTTGAIPSSGTIAVAVVCSGTSVKTYVDGAEKLFVTTSTQQTATRIGMRVNPSSIGTSRWDNLQANP